MNKHFSILIIDDHANFLKMVKSKLGTVRGYTVYTSQDGIEGIQLARRHRPNMILLDWVMPGMDGLEVLKELKDSEATRGIHVYMLTTKSKMGDVEDALHLGADGYLTKPMEMDALVKRIQHIFDRNFAAGADID